MSSKSFTQGSIVKSLLALSIPVVFANLLHTAYQLIDTFWVGRLGAEAVAAVSLSFPIIFLMMSLGGGLSIAKSILVAQSIGRKDIKRAIFVSGQTILMMGLVAIPLSLIGIVFSEPIMHLIGAEAEVLPLAVSYMRISFVGLISVFGFFVFQSLMRSIGDVKTPIYVVLSTVILNFFLDPLFINGFAFVPSFGVAGAAIATVITQSVATLIGLGMLFSGKYGIHLTKSSFNPDKELIVTLFRLGMPASIEQSMRALGLTLMTFLVASFGTTIVAGYGIGIRILSFVIIPAFGLGMATSTIVGQNIGARKLDRAEKSTRLSVLIGFGSLTAIGVLVYIFAEQLCAVFISGNGGALQGSIEFVRVMALSFGFLGVIQSINGTFQGSGNTFASMLITLVSQWVFQFPLAYVLSRHTTLEAAGIWWAFPISNIAVAAISIYWFLRGDWKNKKLLATSELENEVIEETMIEEGM